MIHGNYIAAAFGTVYNKTNNWRITPRQYGDSCLQLIIICTFCKNILEKDMKTFQSILWTLIIICTVYAKEVEKLYVKV
jgi:hypothetical protein